MAFLVSAIGVMTGYAMVLWKLWHKPVDRGKASFYSIVWTVLALTLLGLIAVSYLLFLLMQLGGITTH